MMDFEHFASIRKQLIALNSEVTEGKMMSSPAMHYRGRVFAFFSRKQKLVVKLGKDYPLESLEIAVQEFSPFKTKKPLSGWYEIEFIEEDSWSTMAELALGLAKENMG